MRPALLILFLALLVVFSIRLFHPPSQPSQIALTFDDLPLHGDLPPGVSRLDVIRSILATLKSEKIPPTYGFLNGSPVESDPTLLDALKAWRAAAQPLGNHTWSHPSLTTSTPEQFEQDISRNEPILEDLMGNGEWRYFRYPYLDQGDTPAKRQAVSQWLPEHRYRVAQVTQDFADYRWNAPYSRCATQRNEPAILDLEATYLAAADRQLTRAQTISRLRYGREIPFVVLLHAGAFDAHMLPHLIALYRRHGLTFVTLQQAQADPAYQNNPAQGLKRGVSILNHLAALVDRLRSPNQSQERGLKAFCP